MTNAQSPDAMKKLVLFIIGIAILGTIIALAVHYGVEQPAQQAPQAPVNWQTPAQNCFTCQNDCINGCALKNPTGGTPEFFQCVNTCQANCNDCKTT